MNKSEQDMIDMIKQNEIYPQINKEHRDALRDRALEAYDKQAAVERPTNFKPLFRIKGTTLMKFAASITLFAVIGFFSMTLLTPTKAIAFDQVADAILQIDTASYEAFVTVTDESGKRTTPIGGFTVDYPGQLRFESPDGMVSVSDTRADRLLVTHAKTKTAVIVNNASQSDIGALVAYESLDLLNRLTEHLDNAKQGNRLDDIKYLELGTKNIDGVACVGYRFEEPGDGPIDMWADAKTGLPVHIESNSGSTTSIIKNFKFNHTLPPALFSFEPPVGYQVVVMNPEPAGDDTFAKPDDFIQALRHYADYVDGQFPPALNDATFKQAHASVYNKMHPDKPYQPGETYPDDVSEVVLDMMIGTMFIDDLNEQGVQFGYAGKGVKLGEKDTPIFWYKSQRGDSWLVIYGDLSTRDAKEPPAK